MKPTAPVTMRQIAQAAGVSVSTVSKALRNDPSISGERQLAIKAIAERMGYRPHPMVSALMSRIHHHRRRNDPLKIAWIDLWPSPKEGGGFLSAESLLAGATARAEQLGYGLEIHPVGRDAIPAASLSRMLASRSQWGLIIPPTPEPHLRYPMSLEGLAGVAIGSSLLEPVMHRVSPNHFQGCVLAWSELRARGYRRVGIALTPEMNSRVEGRWTGAFMACQLTIPRKERLAPHLAPLDDHDSLARWWRTEKPDAVLLSEKLPWVKARTLLDGMREIPAIAALVHQPDLGALGGVNYRPEQLGSTAVEMVVAQIHRNERGSPSIPHTVLIDATWSPGNHHPSNPFG